MWAETVDVSDTCRWVVSIWLEAGDWVDMKRCVHNDQRLAGRGAGDVEGSGLGFILDAVCSDYCMLKHVWHWPNVNLKLAGERRNAARVTGKRVTAHECVGLRQQSRRWRRD